ncbi:TIGR02281 family clan AA aspartic protease [Jiella sp. MQZ9-1]|uniref:TIGR02281 family clan AA aspartic protease n=1 Tax=Jiella flava TaxID=2816857 RepID=A0A939JW73_9HYPH|nr:TIGR02281 family clan AA aspartic protease [Jiella flava]MBO0662001.1 TIGR02281 family clan AA aspartic protease [Jiella flava]MCD2470672.1 TIGR02281 family clan AA aspartic protease [Jiella flava]
MHNYLVLLVVASVAALAAPSLFERYQSEIAAGTPEIVRPAPHVVEAAAPALASEIRITGDRSGHFMTDVAMNGQAVPVIVDTGASVVALDEDTADRLGIRPAASDFVQPVQTANGVARAARASIDAVAVGGITLRDVDAMVIKGVALPRALLGMSFLQRLKGYSVENGALTLRN